MAAYITCLRTQTFKTHKLTNTIRTYLAQIVMDFAIAINAAALQPGVIDQAQQSLFVSGTYRLRLIQRGV